MNPDVSKICSAIRAGRWSPLDLRLLDAAMRDAHRNGESAGFADFPPGTRVSIHAPATAEWNGRLGVVDRPLKVKLSIRLDDGGEVSANPSQLRKSDAPLPEGAALLALRPVPKDSPYAFRQGDNVLISIPGRKWDGLQGEVIRPLQKNVLVETPLGKVRFSPRALTKIERAA